MAAPIGLPSRTILITDITPHTTDTTSSLTAPTNPVTEVTVPLTVIDLNTVDTAVITIITAAIMEVIGDKTIPMLTQKITVMEIEDLPVQMCTEAMITEQQVQDWHPVVQPEIKVQIPETDRKLLTLIIQEEPVLVRV